MNIKYWLVITGLLGLLFPLGQPTLLLKMSAITASHLSVVRTP